MPILDDLQTKEKEMFQVIAIDMAIPLEHLLADGELSYQGKKSILEQAGWFYLVAQRTRYLAETCEIKDTTMPKVRLEGACLPCNGALLIGRERALYLNVS